MVEKFQEAFAQVKEHQNAKLVHAAEFQTDTNHLKKWVLQINDAMTYQCKLKNERIGYCGPEEVIICSHLWCIIM